MQKIFQLKKRGWYIRLLRFMWGVQYEDFTHMCPLFWLTVVSIILFIPWLVFMGIGKCVITTLDAYRTNIRKREKEKEDKENMESAALYERICIDAEARKDFAMKVYMSWYENECIPRSYALVQTYRMSEKERIDLNALVQMIVRERAEIREAKQKAIIDAYQKKQAAIIARKQRINKILRQFKPLAMFILWLLGIATIILAGWGIYEVIRAIAKVPAKIWISILLWSCFVIVLFLVIFALSKANWSFLRFRLSCEGEKRVIAFFRFFGKYIFGPPIWLFKGIAKIFVITFHTVRNECPPVEWKD